MKKPFYKQVWFWVVVVVLGGIIGLFTEDKTPEEPAIAEPQKEQAKPTEPEKKKRQKNLQKRNGRRVIGKLLWVKLKPT